MTLAEITAFILAASTAMGVKPLPYKVMPLPGKWAQLCFSCEATDGHRRINLDTYLVEYSVEQPRFAQHVIAHEVCHQALKHQPWKTPEMRDAQEEAADLCAREYVKMTFTEEMILYSEADDWLKKRMER